MKKLDCLYNYKSEISSNVCNAVEGHCLQAMKIVHHYAHGRFDWLISEVQRVNPSREAISILSGKYRRFTFVHPVTFKEGINCSKITIAWKDKESASPCTSAFTGAHDQNE